MWRGNLNAQRLLDDETADGRSEIFGGHLSLRMFFAIFLESGNMKWWPGTCNFVLFIMALIGVMWSEECVDVHLLSLTETSSWIEFCPPSWVVYVELLSAQYFLPVSGDVWSAFCSTRGEHSSTSFLRISTMMLVTMPLHEVEARKVQESQDGKNRRQKLKTSSLHSIQTNGSNTQLASQNSITRQNSANNCEYSLDSWVRSQEFTRQNHNHVVSTQLKCFTREHIDVVSYCYSENVFSLHKSEFEALLEELDSLSSLEELHLVLFYYTVLNVYMKTSAFVSASLKRWIFIYGTAHLQP